jgi:glycosyltransferase involved in cell wall biosynthesis
VKIAIYYESRLGRNDGPPLYWNNAMKNMGHDVTHLSSAAEPDKEWGKFDFHMWVDWGEDALGGALPYHPISMSNLHPSIYVSSDTHLGYDYRLNKAKEFDNVFCNQIRGVEDFRKDGVNSNFLPHAVEPQAYPNEPVAIKKYDIGFVGFVSFEKRVDILDRLFKEFPNFWFGQKLFEECAEVYRKSRIVFNTAAVDDINMRCFEATATGSFLLTEWVPTLSECFEDGKHLVTYKDMDEAVEKARYYLSHEEEREAIAKAGMEHTLANHTYLHRAKKILEVINGNT